MAGSPEKKHFGLGPPPASGGSPGREGGRAGKVRAGLPCHLRLVGLRVTADGRLALLLDQLLVGVGGRRRGHGKAAAVSAIGWRCMSRFQVHFMSTLRVEDELEEGGHLRRTHAFATLIIAGHLFPHCFLCRLSAFSEKSISKKNTIYHHQPKICAWLVGGDLHV